MAEKDGIEQSTFVNEIGEMFQCTICTKVFNNPKMCSSGHVFCDFCFCKWLHIANKCALCAQMLVPSQLKTCLVSSRYLNAQLTFCPTRDRNAEIAGLVVDHCSWIGPLAERTNHIQKECAYALPCPSQNCTHKMINQEYLKEHVSTCTSIPRVDCQCCHLSIVLRQISDHLLTCRYETYATQMKQLRKTLEVNKRAGDLILRWAPRMNITDPTLLEFVKVSPVNQIACEFSWNSVKQMKKGDTLDGPVQIVRFGTDNVASALSIYILCSEEKKFSLMASPEQFPMRRNLSSFLLFSCYDNLDSFVSKMIQYDYDGKAHHTVLTYEMLGFYQANDSLRFIVNLKYLHL